MRATVRLAPMFLASVQAMIVGVFLRSNRYEQVAGRSYGIAQGGNRGRKSHVGQKIAGRIELFYPGLVIVDNDDILIFAGEKTRQMRSYFACSCYYDFHF